MVTVSKFLGALALASSVYGDVYLQFPPGSNDRCDRRNNDRRNANRLFDSENNAAGGYPFQGNFRNTVYNRQDLSCAKSDTMSIYGGSKIDIQYTSQHGCGEGNNCQVIIQMGFQSSQASGFRSLRNIGDGRPEAPGVNVNGEPIDADGDSSCTETRPNISRQKLDKCLRLQAIRTNDENPELGNPENLNQNQANNAFNNDDDCTNNADTLAKNNDQGDALTPCTFAEHESFEDYAECECTSRNKGLYTAGEINDNDEDATFSRQNPGGTRSGLECTEERDYHPYWRATPWATIALKTTGECPEVSDVDQTYMKCIGYNGEATPGQNDCQEKRPINEQACIIAGGSWELENIQTLRQALASDYGVGVNGRKALDTQCGPAIGSRQNTLGASTVISEGIDGETTVDFATHEWEVPDVDKPMKIVLRIRYNISNPMMDELRAADDDLIQNDPYVTVNTGTSQETVRLAINNQQTPRAFQDRTWTLTILPKEQLISRNGGECNGAAIRNLSVKGKRGNIAQVRNNAEYMFHPMQMTVKTGECIHPQFIGSDYNDQGNDGEGRAGTDRNNMVQVESHKSIYPIAERELVGSTGVTSSGKPGHFFSVTNQQKMLRVGQDVDNPDECIQNYGDNTNDQNQKNCAVLNKAPAYFDAGPMKIDAPVGEYTFFSSRNNNFSNRSSKLRIKVALDDTTITLIAVGAGVGGVVFLTIFLCILKSRGALCFATASKKPNKI